MKRTADLLNQKSKLYERNVLASTYLNSEVYDRFRRLCYKNNHSMSVVLSTMVEDFVEQFGKLPRDEVKKRKYKTKNGYVFK